MTSKLFNEVFEMTRSNWQEFEPMRDVRMPVLETKKIVATENFNALWTDGGLRPNPNNLAFLMQDISNVIELEKWKNRLKTFPVRASLLVSSSSNDLYLLEPHSDSLQSLTSRQLKIEDWIEILESSKPHLFTPKALAKFRQGQLSLADLEENVSERSFNFIMRQQQQIDAAFTKGIRSALEIVKVERNDSFYTRIQGHIIRYSIAYLAGRILQDKNFFGTGKSIHDEDQDPIALLNRMISVANGFFRNSKKSESFLLEHTRVLFDCVRQELVENIGYKVSFALTDHRDVGSLYEKAIKELPPPKELSGKEWGDLNRHYTPVKIAERMLEALPLERLRPKERYIFDPAAGSGSLLLAATSRLAAMTDTPTGIERQRYLKAHVAGNDKDEYAKLIAQLRYFLASESLGQANEQITNTLPFPDEDRNFTCEDYETLDKDNLPIKPKVIIANPPFMEEGKTQKAARFVQKALEWLDDGSQFAFVLPQSFLAGTTHGFSQARELLAERSQLLEVWQFPEKSVGIDAAQAVCVVIGIIGQSQKVFPVSSKAVFSQVKEEAKNIREKGFLGASWLNSFNTINTTDVTQSWRFSIAPPIPIKVPKISLGNLFYIFSGVNPGKFSKIYPPEDERREGIPYKRNWRLKWRNTDSLWADPQKVPNDERWIMYGKEYLEGYRPENQDFFDISKVLIARKVNRGSHHPLVSLFDEEGFCPDENVFCALPTDYVNKYNHGYQEPKKLPAQWRSLTYEDKCLWLVGICTSKIANSLSLIGRKTREITESELCRLDLPFEIDLEIIQITRQIIDLEKKRNPLLEEQIKELRQVLDQRVEKSYGNPSWKEITRIGESPELKQWKEEQKKKTKMAIGQVLEISEDQIEVLMYISRLMDDDETEGEWIPLPQELPGWALDGTPFEVQLSKDIKTFQQLRERPWALRKFVHTPRPYLTNEELEEFLRIPELELPL